jgi:hypothetical protein
VPTYNSNATVNDWNAAIAANPELAEKIWARKLHLDAMTHDDLSAFESNEVTMGSRESMDPNTPRGIICRKSEFSKVGGDTMKFTVMGPPAGPGVQGEVELTGKTSTPTFNQYECKIEYKRDAVEYTKKHLRNFTNRDQIVPATQSMMSIKAGLRRQREMMLTFRRYASGNIFRPNGRLSQNGLEYADTLDPTAASSAKAKATTNGATPISKLRSRFGTISHGYLCFATEEAMAGVRNHTGYQNALQHAGERGDKNPLFTGRLVPYNNVHYFEHFVINPGWNDVIGSPLAPRARLRVGFGADSAQADCILKGGTAASTTNLYFQDFLGYDYLFTENQAAAADATEYYAWIVNPDGTVGFVAYTGSGNNGNQITVTKILNPDQTADGSTIGQTTVGNITCAGDFSAADTPLWGVNHAGNAYVTGVGGGAIAIGGGAGVSNTSADHVYTSQFVAGATIIQANANGVPLGWSFLFGANAAVRGYGQQEVSIKQERDYGWVKGMGYEGCWGQSLCERSDGLVNGYQLIEHAIHPEGFDLPAVA